MPLHTRAIRVKPRPRTITVDELSRLSFTNSPRMPQTINEDGIRKQWVGIGWVEEGPANGTEDAVVTK